MKITLLTVGKTDVRWVREGLDLYVSRLRHYVPFALTEIPELKKQLLQLGAAAASMSGSGPTVYGLFRDEAKAKEAYLSLRGSCPRRYVVLYTNTENPRYQQGGVWKQDA